MIPLRITERVTGAFSGISASVTIYASSNGIIIEHIRIRHTRQIGLWLMERVAGAFSGIFALVTHHASSDGIIIEHIRVSHTRHVGL